MVYGRAVMYALQKVVSSARARTPASVEIELKGGNSVAAVITNDAVKSLKLREGTPASAKYLTGALQAPGFDVTVASTSHVPATPAEVKP